MQSFLPLLLCYLFRSVTPIARKLDKTILFLSLSHLWLSRRYSAGNKPRLNNILQKTGKKRQKNVLDIANKN